MDVIIREFGWKKKGLCSLARWVRCSLKTALRCNREERTLIYEQKICIKRYLYNGEFS